MNALSPDVPLIRIDLNADLGEGFGRWSLGDDEALLDVITSANVACGFHAGDPTIMRWVCAGARERGVIIGAQVSYRDLAGFGRRPISMPHDELTNDIVYQIGGLDACARAEGTAQATSAGLHTVAEAFPDRAYEADGQLRSRRLPGAVLHDIALITERAVQIACHGRVPTFDSEPLSLRAQSLCLHGDNVAAVEAARSVARALAQAGVTVAAFVRSS